MSVDPTPRRQLPPRPGGKFTLGPAVQAALGRATETFSAFRDLDSKAKALLILSASGKHIYAGTVPYAEVQRRRASNRVARASRRANRGRA